MRRQFFRNVIFGVLLGAALRGDLACPQAWAYGINNDQHLITISPTGDYTADARKAIAFLLARQDTGTVWTVKFQPGKYYLTLPLYSVGLQNVTFASDPANPARLIKGSSFAGDQEYLFYTRMSRNIVVRGFEFYGKTSFAKSAAPVWPDQGIYFGSCNTITVDQNKFYNFGNAALRVTTNEMDPNKNVNSYNSTITNNLFNNIYQISTSSNDTVHGATSSYRLQKNTFVNLRGSVKFASRTPGAKDIHVVENLINGGNRFGLEIDNFNNFEIRGNTIQNIDSVAINIYTATDKSKITKGFEWGNNFTISDNHIKSCGRGIRFSHEPFADGFQSVPKTLSIVNNTLDTVKDGNKDIPAIAVINGKVDGVKVSSNQFSAITSKNYIAIPSGSTNIVQENNQVDGAAYGAQSSGGGSSSESPPPTAASGSPTAPSNLAGNYDGKLSVRLTWKDNASNEKNQEVWGSPNGKQYSLIAKLYANKTVFTHQLKRVPQNPVFYYALKAVNDNGASGLSNTVKVTFN